MGLGFPVRKNHLFDCVQKFIKINKRKVPFKDDRPGRRWFEGFMARHKNLSLRIAQNLTHRRVEVTETEIRDWFARLKVNLEKKKLLNISPSRIFKCDETSFMLCPDCGPASAEKVYQLFTIL